MAEPRSNASYVRLEEPVRKFLHRKVRKTSATYGINACDLPDFKIYSKKAIFLGLGLPEGLCAYDCGTLRLRKLVGLNGDRLSWFLNIGMVKQALKNAHLSNASKNEKLVFALGLPHIRLNLFRWAVKDLLETGVTCFPSPELSILKTLDASFPDIPYDSDKLSTVPEITSMIGGDAEINKRAAMLWLPFTEKLAAWTELNSEAKEELINVAFALITIAQDVQAGEYAVALQPELEPYIAFILESQMTSDEDEELEMIATSDGEQQYSVPADCSWDAIMGNIANEAREAIGCSSLEVVETLRGLLSHADFAARREQENMRRKDEVEIQFKAFTVRIDAILENNEILWLSDSRSNITAFWKAALAEGDTAPATLDSVASQAEGIAGRLTDLLSERAAMETEMHELELSVPPRRSDPTSTLSRIEELSRGLSATRSAIFKLKQEIYGLLLPESDGEESETYPAKVEEQLKAPETSSPPEICIEPPLLEDSSASADADFSKPQNDDTPESSPVASSAVTETASTQQYEHEVAQEAQPPVSENEVSSQSIHEEPETVRTELKEALVPAKSSEESIGAGTGGSADSSPEDMDGLNATSQATQDSHLQGEIWETSSLTVATNELANTDTGTTGANGTDVVRVVDRAEGGEVTVDSQAIDAEQIVWRLLARKQPSAAYNLARAYEEQNQEELTITSPLLATVALAPHVRYDTGDVANVLKGSFSAISPHCTSEAGLLVVGAALRPALLAPSTNVGRVLRIKPRNDLDHFYNYCQAIADFTEFHQPLDPTALNQAKDAAAWKDELQTLQHEVKAWFEHVRYHNLIGPANRVWKKWLERGELVREALTPIIEDDRRKLDDTRKLVTQLTTDSEIEREIEKTDNKLRNIRRAGDEITAKSLSNLKHHLREVTAFLQRWLTLTGSDPGQEKGFKHQLAEKIRHEIISRQSKVIAEMQACLAGETNGAGRTALEFCLESVTDLENLFTPDAPLSFDEVPAHLLLNADLLRVPGLSLNERWEPGEETRKTLLPSLEGLVDTGLHWMPFYYLHAKAGDHVATGRILEFLKATGDPTGELNLIEQERQGAIKDRRDSLQMNVDSTRDQIEKAYAFGIITGFRRTALIAEVEAIENTMGTTFGFTTVSKKLEEIDEQIAAARKRQIEDAYSQMTKRGINQNHATYERIRTTLDSGDVLTVNEYIEMVQAGQELPTADVEADPFRAFFPQIANYLYEVLSGDSNLSSVISKVRNRNFPEIDMKHVPGAQAEQAASMLESWYRLKREEKVLGNTGQAENILKSLGFSSVKVMVDDRREADRGRNRSQSHSWCNCTTDTLENKSICPVSVYGSGAGGRYRMLCVWGRPSEEEVAQLVGDTPAIVFYFGCMTEQRRRGLAKLCRQENKTFLLIDDILMVYLCGVRGSRLQVLFRCALPFTHFEPYITTGGLVPVEMFYGRLSERNSIVSALESSASMIYGGRQLGKTALLKEAERSFTDMAEGRVALYIDLKGEAIEIDEIWSLLARKFRSLGVLEQTINIHLDSKKLMTLIEQWLNALPDRRILLLLDEADRFMESDAKEDFKRTSLLKNLMERTGRRFKVVFSGLHNVQRTARQNDPIAHFGDAICIGPLVERGEWREARALLEVPMATLGYYFDNQGDSLDLVTRILSQTNYYPSLIQLYCKQLLDHLTEDAVRRGTKAGPPYRISAKQVDDAYRNQDLQKAIRHRFMLTLRLDPRYELIAYAIAWGFLNNGKNMIDGYPLGWIRDQALSWWEPGFRNCNDFESFRALVDEMVGLGVLRQTSKDQYTFRSLNVISLMGDQETIEDALQTQRELPAEYEPNIFRKTLKLRGQAKCSPLTAREISHLKSQENGIVIITGSKASGLDDVEAFIEDTFQEGYFKKLDSVFDNISFSKKLDEIVVDRKKDGTTIYLVDYSVPWSEQWVDSAQAKLSKLKSHESFAKIVFVADNKLSYTLLDGTLRLLRETDVEGLTVMPLKPWHSSVVKQWLEDSSLGPVDGQIEKIGAVTGNWPALMYEFQSQTKNLYQWSHSLEDLKKNLASPMESRRFQEIFGVENYPVSTVFSALAILNDDLPTTNDLCATVEGVRLEEIDKVMRWGYLLGYVSPQGRDSWRINDVIGDLFKQGEA